VTRSPEQLFEYISECLTGLFRTQNTELMSRLHGSRDGLTELYRRSRGAEGQGAYIVAATQRADREADTGTLPRRNPALDREITDLSHMPPLGELVDAASRGDLDKAGLTEAFNGLERRYGPYDIGRVTAWPERGYTHLGEVFPPQIVMSADIVADGTKVGKVIYNFRRDPDGQLVAFNEVTVVEKPEYRGKGFSTAFSDATEAYFRRSGVARLEVEATAVNGGVTWAQTGYGWDLTPRKLESSLANVGRRIDELIDLDAAGMQERKIIVSDDDRAALERFRARLAGPAEDLPTPQELVALTGSEGSALGREIMGTSWYGVKQLS
jgi:GNAT superfamily N-acetyltransferase